MDTDALPDSASWNVDSIATPAPQSSTQQLIALHNVSKRSTLPQLYPPGVSGNAGNHRETLQNRILERTDNGFKLVEKAMIHLESPNTRLVIHAMDWLTERAFGKAEQLVSGTVDHNVNVYQAVDTETLRTMCRQRDELLQLVRDGKIRVVESVSIPESNETLSQPDSSPATLDVSTQAE